MDPRLLAYWLTAADAVHRQATARLAQAVRAGMAEGPGFSAFMRSLELDKSTADHAADTWETLRTVEPRGYAGKST